MMLARRIVGPERPKQEHSPRAITERERIYLMAMAEHDGLAGAAEALGVSRSAVKQTVARARKKMGARSVLTLYHRLTREDQ